MSEQDVKQQNRNFFWSRVAIFLFFILLICVKLFPPTAWMGNLTKNYLPVHIVLEFIGILISFAIFTVGWATYQNAKSTDILVLSVVSFMVGCLDLGHTLSFTGMPDFVTPSGPNKSIHFWLVGRLTGSIGFLIVSLSKPREFKIKRLRFIMMLGAILWVAMWFYLILYKPDDLPVMFIPGMGLQPLKVVLEWSAVIISFVSGVLFFRQGLRKNLFSLHWIGCSSILFAMSGYFFTIYRDFDDLYNFFGHVYKAVAFILVYRAVFIECVSKPYDEARVSAKEALEANISKSRFLANVSHEFRTPLGVIAGFSEMLLESKSLVPENRRWAEIISRNSRQLRVLIDDLLDLAKAEHEKISVEFCMFHPSEMIEDVVNSLRLQADKKGITVSFNNALPKDFVINSDQFRFSQILLNVVGNAIKFTSYGGVEVSLSFLPDQKKIEILVKDSGIGIDTNQAGKLFKPFAQADDPMNRRFGGTGLGLALSQKLANLLGGDLWLQSSEPGQGSTFIFTIADQLVLGSSSILNPKLSEIKRIEALGEFAGLRILAAEDSLDNQSLLSIYLQATGAQLTFANNGREAVELAQQQAYDLILMDIQMPLVDGFEAVNLLREAKWQGPILALSAHAHAPERERALQNGFDDYLVKPISRAKLLKAIADYRPKNPKI